MNGNDLGSCLIAGLVISDVKSSGSVTTVFVSDELNRR